MMLRVIGLSVAGLFALGAVSCSDSPLPPAKGGSNFRITSGGCNQNGSFPIPAGQTPTDVTYLGARVEDTEGGSVSCEVRESGGTYVLSGTIQEGQRSFTVYGSVAAAGDGSYTGTGSVIHYDSVTGQLQSNETTQCTLTVNANQDVAPGRIWGNYNCTEVGDYGAPGVRCSAEGSYVLENCDK